MTARWTLHEGDVERVLAGVADCSFDALLCDPPYGFSFMGKAWDYSVPSVDLWRECLRVLKPGAPLVAFGGSRTYHRLACGIEDAGFELRDQLMWLYGNGFPKSQNIGLAIDKAAGATREVVGINEDRLRRKPNGMQTAGATAYGYSQAQQDTNADITTPATALAQQWDGWGTALKPAHEPIVLARKPLDGTMAQNVARWGVGGLAIDACRIEGIPESPGSTPPTANGNTLTHGAMTRTAYETQSGRWPANLLLDEEAAALLDAEVGDRPSRPSVTRNGGGGGMLPGAPLKGIPRHDSGYADSGGPSRFFFCSKVSTEEREFGCEALPLRSAGEMTGDREEESAGLESPRTGAGRTGGARNHHPTLKPISLTTWLASLIMPPGAGTILVPFAGAGSEMIGCLRAGWTEVVGIERDPEYAEIARRRIARWELVPAQFEPIDATRSAREAAPHERQTALFGASR